MGHTETLDIGLTTLLIIEQCNDTSRRWSLKYSEYKCVAQYANSAFLEVSGQINVVDFGHTFMP